MADQSKGFSIMEIEIGGVLIVVGIAAVFLLPPLIKLLQIPGDIIDAPGKALDLVKAAAKDTSSDAYSNAATSIPGLSSETLAKYVDNKMFTKFDNVPIRQTPHSNAPVIKYINNSGDSPGYVYSAAGEQLGTQNIVWFNIEDVPGGSPNGWIRLTDVTVPDSGISGIGCAKCSGNCIGCISSIIN